MTLGFKESPGPLSVWGINLALLIACVSSFINLNKKFWIFEKLLDLLKLEQITETSSFFTESFLEEDLILVFHSNQLLWKPLLVLAGGRSSLFFSLIEIQEGNQVIPRRDKGWPQYHPKGLLKISILNMRTLALKVDYWLYRVSYIEAWEEVCDPAILRGKSSSMEKRLQLKLC